MADLSKTIQIIFGIDDGNTGSKLDYLNSQFSAVGTGIHSIADPIGGFTESMLKAEAAVAAMGAALVAFSINEAGQFKGAMNEITALFNGTAEDSQKLGDNIKEFAASSTQSIDSINQATYTAISTGTQWAHVTETLAASEKLAVAGATSLDVSTAALSRTMNAYGLEASQATSVSESLLVAAQQGDTNLTALGSAFGKVATQAASASVGLDEALAALSAVTIAGINTDEATTLLKALFKELASPTKELTAALGGMNLETNSLQEIMQKLKSVTGGTFAEMDKLFSSSEAVNGALILSNDSAGKFAGTLDAMANKAGSVDKAYELMANDIEKLNQNLANNIKVTFIKAGEDLLDEYGTITKALSSIFKTLGVEIESGALTPIQAAIESFLGDVGKQLEGISLALPEALSQLDFTGLLNSFGDLSDEIGKVFGSIFGKDLDLSKPEDLAKVLQQVVNSITSLVNITRSIVDQFTPVFDLFGEFGKSLSGLDKNTSDSIGQFLALSVQIKEFGIGIGSALTIIEQTGTDVKNVLDVLIGGGKLLINTLQIAFDEGAYIIVKALAEVSEKIGLFLDFIGLDTFANKFKDQATKLNDLTKGIVISVQENTKDFNSAWNQVGDGLSGSVDKVSQSTQKLSRETERVTENFVQMQGGTAGLIDAFALMGKSIDPLTGQVSDIGNVSGRTAEEINALLDPIYNVDRGISDLGDSFAGNNAVFDAYGNLISRTGPIMDDVAAKTDNVKSAVDKLSEREKFALEQTQELILQYNELASNERINALELGANIQTAQIEADAQTVVAAFESIGLSVQATQETTASLFSDLTKAFGDPKIAGLDKIHLERFAKEQQKQAQQALDIQENLTNAQIDLIQARIDAYQRGDGLITVNADNLEPELRQVLRSLLENIQIEASAEGLELLL